MKNKLLLIFSLVGLIAGCLTLSLKANAKEAVAPSFNVIDTPPPARIMEPVLHPADTGTGVKATQHGEVIDGNPQEVVNPE